MIEVKSLTRVCQPKHWRRLGRRGTRPKIKSLFSYCFLFSDAHRRHAEGTGQQFVVEQRERIGFVLQRQCVNERQLMIGRGYGQLIGFALLVEIDEL